MTRPVVNVLSIAGSDPTGGAGIQGDLKTYAALGVYGCAVPTALTAQNTRGVAAVMPVPTAFVVRQLETLLDDVEIHAVKIGMLGNAITASAVAEIIRRYRLHNIVLDPVMRASADDTPLDGGALRVIRDELLPLVAVVTPNAAEAGALVGGAPPRIIVEAAAAGRAIVAVGAAAALVTGGHLDDAGTCIDVLVQDGVAHELRTPRVEHGGTHGTGCALSSAIAAMLALGHDLPTACAAAQSFVADAVRASGLLRVGRGIGPVHVGNACRDQRQDIDGTAALRVNTVTGS